LTRSRCAFTDWSFLAQSGQHAPVCGRGPLGRAGRPDHKGDRQPSGMTWSGQGGITALLGGAPCTALLVLLYTVTDEQLRSFFGWGGVGRCRPLPSRALNVAAGGDGQRRAGAQVAQRRRRV